VPIETVGSGVSGCSLLAVVAAEHLKAVGWWRGFEAEQLVADVMAKAAAKARIAMDMSKVMQPRYNKKHASSSSATFTAAH
jgi:hypothetical protein